MQFTTVGLLQNDIIQCSPSEAEKTSSQACAQKLILEYSPNTFYQSTQNHLALKTQRNSTCNIASGRIL